LNNSISPRQQEGEIKKLKLMGKSKTSVDSTAKKQQDKQGGGRHSALSNNNEYTDESAILPSMAKLHAGDMKTLQAAHLIAQQLKKTKAL
jgi:hypothetical protein